MAFLSRKRINGLFYKLMLCIVLLPTVVQSASLEQVKMAFVYNFSRYITWPEMAFSDEASPFTICLDANNDQVTLLELTVQGETVNDRHYEIKKINNYESLNNCQILFVSAKRYNEEFQIPENLASKILYVSDAHDFAQHGGMIELKQDKQRLKLFVNLRSVKSSDLRFRSNLLKLMTVVK